MFGMALRAYQTASSNGSRRAPASANKRCGAPCSIRSRTARRRVRRCSSASRATTNRACARCCANPIDAGRIECRGKGARTTYASAPARAEGATRAGRGTRPRGTALGARTSQRSDRRRDCWAERLRLAPAVVAAVLQRLTEQGRLELHGDHYESHDFRVPLGASSGWEAAVLDHVQAVVQTICQRLLAGPVVPAGRRRTGRWQHVPLRRLGRPSTDRRSARSTLALSRRALAPARARRGLQPGRMARPRRFRQVVVYGGQCTHERERARGHEGARGDEVMKARNRCRDVVGRSTLRGARRRELLQQQSGTGRRRQSLLAAMHADGAVRRPGPRVACVAGHCQTAADPSRASAGEPNIASSSDAGKISSSGEPSSTRGNDSDAATSHSSTMSDATPLVMVLVDTSASMERLSNCACTSASCDECLPDCSKAVRNRWAEMLEVLTGTFDDFSCEALDRTAENGATYDLGFAMPVSPPVGNAT